MPRERIDDQALLEDLRETAEKVDGDLTMNKYRKHGEHSQHTFERAFGSWNDAKEEAGLETNPSPQHISDAYDTHREFRVEALSNALRQLDYVLEETEFCHHRAVKRKDKKKLRQARNIISKIMCEDERRLDD